MKTFVTCSMIAALVLVAHASAPAQQPGHRPEHQPPAATMEMCRQMMGHAGAMGGMGGGTMGPMGMMPTMGGGDPKHHADMMEMHGEMMKAMGDIMMKYAGRMRPAK